ncbi:MAG: DUF4974 domain-containing protein [Muribaculaceae bacterium]|nr:DUF4974 domain-containing protein [Muribaculaceae bacterium]
MKDKTDRLLDLLENSDKYSDAELNALLQDREMKELYNVVSKTSDALAETPVADTDKEWQKFARTHFGAKRVNILGFVSRNVAAVVLCVVVSLAVVATTVGLHYSINPEIEPNEPEITVVKEAKSDILTDTIEKSTLSADNPETVIFKNRSLESIITDIALYYGTTVNFKSSDSKKLRLYFQWNRTLPLYEIIAQLNGFESFNVKLSGNAIIID